MIVAVFGILRFPPESMETVRPHLRELVELTRQHDRCIAYEVAEDVFEPGLVRFSELWPDEGALDRHLNAPHIAPWREVCHKAGLIERSFTAYEASHPRPA
ncbi:MAG: antibiotic biosynthesis monooxygenase family protein [Proteobacteria bacterium]|nr:antibiotic biosynthesis monooxygenase family protein [Pseudomonadota bacterium]